MSFWTGLEALSGHRPGAFTGMTMRDLFDKDMWDRLPRTWSGQRTPTGPLDIRTGRAGEPMMTAWRRGGNQAGNEAAHTQHAMAQALTNTGLMKQNEMAAQVQTRALTPTPNLNPQPVPGWTPPRNPAEVVQETGRYYGMGDPYSGWGGYIGSAKNAHMGMGAVPPMLDKTTVVTESNNPNEFTTKKTTYKQQVPTPTNTLMNMGTSLWEKYDRMRQMRLLDSMMKRRSY